MQVSSESSIHQSVPPNPMYSADFDGQELKIFLAPKPNQDNQEQKPKQKIPNAALGPNFYKSNNKSEWAQLIKLINNKIREPSPDIETIKTMARTIVEQLKIDEAHVQAGEYAKVSDCGLFVPRLGCASNKKTNPIRLVNTMAEMLYCETGRMSVPLHAYIHWNRFVAKLTKIYVEEENLRNLLKAEFKMSRMMEHQRNSWCVLKAKTIAEPVGKPTAMKVDIAQKEELAPFFAHLASNGSIDQAPYTQFVRGTVYPDGRMDLCKQVVGPTWIGDLMESLKPNNKITHFLLGNNITGNPGAKAIKEFLLGPHKGKIQTWYLAGSDFNSQAMNDLADGLSLDPDCNALWLKRNPLYAESGKHLRKLLESNKVIKILDLHNTGLGLSEKAYKESDGRYEKYLTNEGLEQLFEGLKVNESVKYLYLDANGLTSSSVNIIVNYLEFKTKNARPGIHSLWMDMNKLEDEGIEKLAKGLSQYPQLKRLFIGSTMCSNIGAKYIADAVSKLPNLLVLDMSLYKATADMGSIPNNIGPDGVEHLVRIIKESPSLKYFNCSMNNLDVESLGKLAGALETNTKIVYFSYVQYGLNTPQEIQARIDLIIQRNRVLDPTHKYTQDDARRLRHGALIPNIDSIYRNNMKV